jgi:hypothetical protein
MSTIPISQAFKTIASSHSGSRSRNSITAICGPAKTYFPRAFAVASGYYLEWPGTQYAFVPQRFTARRWKLARTLHTKAAKMAPMRGPVQAS